MRKTLDQTEALRELADALERCARTDGIDEEVDDLIREHLGGCGHFNHPGRCQCENDD